MLHRKHVLLALTFIGLALVMCAPAAFGQTITNDTPITDSRSNTCTGDLVTFSGTLHTEVTSTAAPNGMTHSAFYFTVHATGVGSPSGANYVVNDTIHIESNTKGIAQEQYTGTKLKLIAQGPYPNATERDTLHVIIGSDGSLNVQKINSTITCN